MRRHRNKGTDQADIDMTPMLDIVFILLIFFMVTATFLSEKAIDLQQAPPPIKPPHGISERAITIYVDGKDRCAVEGRGTECDRVILATERILAEKPGANIILKIDKDARHNILVTLKDELDIAGFQTKIEIV